MESQASFQKNFRCQRGRNGATAFGVSWIRNRSGKVEVSCMVLLTLQPTLGKAPENHGLKHTLFGTDMLLFPGGYTRYWT